MPATEIKYVKDGRKIACTKGQGMNQKLQIEQCDGQNYENLCCNKPE